MDHKTERKNDVDKIKNSAHPRKVIVAGPGTGKSHLFSQLIAQKKNAGKTNFLAITFVGKLCDALADDLCGLAETVTMHGLARKIVLDAMPDDWVYYSDIYDVIKEDLHSEGVRDFKVGDDAYKAKTIKYKAIGNADVVHYALQIIRKNKKKTPRYDLILVDEFQDFNEIEAELIDELSTANEMVLVGDDDQALYLFKGSSPEYIRDKHFNGNNYWESHTLRFCSRCTQVIIKYFHSLVQKYELNDNSETDHKKKRVNKDYICYAPDGEKDSKLLDSQVNPHIHLIKSCPPGMIAWKIKEALEDLTQKQKIKDVLVIGEPKTCATILSDTAKALERYGFRFVNYTSDEQLSMNSRTLNGYHFLSENNASLLGWRLLNNPEDAADRKQHLQRVATLKSILDKKPVADSSKDKLVASITTKKVEAEDMKRDTYVKAIKRHFQGVSRPVSNIEITVCNNISSKGLGADVVFIVGFDQGRFPKTKKPAAEEIYQMLVAITRAKKRIYMINTVGRPVSSFFESLPEADVVCDDMTQV